MGSTCKRGQLEGSRPWIINLLLFILVLGAYGDEDDCGMDVAGLIEGGSPAPLGRYPYSASVRFEGLHACGGALISSGWLLTIKACASRRVGFVNRVTIVTGKGQDCGEELKISEIVLEPDGHLALMKLEEKSSQQTVQLNDSGPDKGLELTLLGFGRQSGNSAFTQRLQEATGLEVQDKGVCLLKDRSLSPLLSKLVCAGNVSRACFGDEGGPLVLPDSSSPSDPASDKLIGLAFFPSGSDECGADKPGIFVDVTQSKDWISSVID